MAAPTSYDARAWRQAKSQGIAVTGSVDRSMALAGGRVVIPAEWKSLEASADRLRFRSGHGACHYTTTFTIATRTAPADDDPAAYVITAAPAKGPKYVLDSGWRVRTAFRVVRSGGLPQTVDAVWTGVLTRRSDVAPPGQSVWTTIKAHSVAGARDECHSGTWRETLGPQLGDAMATARTSLHFVRSEREGEHASRLPRGDPCWNAAIGSIYGVAPGDGGLRMWSHSTDRQVVAGSGPQSAPPPRACRCSA